MSVRLLRDGQLTGTPASGGAAGWAALVKAAGPREKTSESTPAASEKVPAVNRFEEELANARNDLERVQAENEARVKVAYQSGFDAGYREAEAKSRGEIESFRKQIASSLSATELARRELLEQADADLVRLSIAIAEKILNRQVQIDPEALAGVTRAALERLHGKAVQRVRIHPDDRAAVEEAIASQSGRQAIRVEADKSLARGAVLFDTNYGTLDASIATQLEEIERGLTDRLRRSMK